MLDARTTADHVHEATLLVAANLPAFYAAYRSWIGEGFNPKPPAARTD